MPVAYNSNLESIHYAKIALKEIYRDGYWYKKSGVIVSEIVSENLV
jgi:DNA polymerase V